MIKRSAQKFYDQVAKDYKKMYEPNYEKYPANLIRLKLIKKRLKANSCHKVLDIGCGTAIPMIKLLEDGFDVRGFDYSKQMVLFGQNELESANFSRDLIYQADLQKNNTIKKQKYDAILALGVFPHIKNEKIALKNLRNLLNNNGKAFIEFRNQLFSTFSLNKFSMDFFLNDLIDLKLISSKTQTQLIDYYSKKLTTKKPKKQKDGRISYDEILAKFHNPLTLNDELFMPLKMKIDKIHFYHFHALPPIFEKLNPNEFRTTSLKIEKPQSWKGYFLSSAFVVECSKI